MRYLILLCLVIPFHSFAETSLWKVTHGTSKLFIGGTIHVLSESDYPLPKEFSHAYRQAQMLVFETDIKAMANPDVQQQLVFKLMYQNGDTLKKNISSETYQKLSDYLLTIGVSIEMFNQLKPSMVSMTLLMMELQRLGMANIGVDNYFLGLAVTDNRALGQLESVDLHIQLLESLGKGQEDEMILNSIKEMEDLPILMEELKAAWRTGNTKKLEEIGISAMKMDFPKLYQSLLVNRNNAWLPKIEALLDTQEIEFVLVGALHLVGEEGIISKLKKKGYKVEKFKD